MVGKFQRCCCRPGVAASSASLFLSILVCTSLSAREEQVVGYDRKQLLIARTSLAPHLDGVLDDAIWQEATRIDDLHQFNPVDQGEPSEASEFYLAYSRDYLYLGARLYDSDPKGIRASQLVQGKSLNADDQIKLILDTFNNGRTGYQFQVNPNGIRREGIFDAPDRLNRDWTGIWQVRSSIDERGWSAEMAIPFTTLNFGPEKDTWGFTVSRTIARKNEDIAWSSFNRSINPTTTGMLSGIYDIDQGVGLDVIPSMVSGLHTDYRTSNNMDRHEPSLNVFYKFTSNFTGAVTINTDFSATEVDNRQVNLSRFSLFFPEKRDFFLQDIDIFSFGGRSADNNNGLPFYSRRIGLGADGGPVDINAGLKLTGRIGRWNLGVLAVAQGDVPGLEGQQLLVARASVNVLSESSLGAILTHGDPLSDRRNDLAGVDFRYRNTRFSETHTLRGDFFFQQSSTAELVGNDQALGASLQLETKGDGLGGHLGYERFGQDFNPALGFANRKGIDLLLAGAQWRRFLSDGIWRTVGSSFEFDHARSLDSGDLESENLTLAPLQLVSHIGTSLDFSVVRSREGLLEDFEIRPGIVVPRGKYEWLDHRVELSVGNQRRLAPVLSYRRGDYWDGKRRFYELGAEWRPGKHFFLRLNYRYRDIRLPAGAFDVRQVSADLNYAINAEWSLVNLIQYDNLSRTVGINSRLRWNPRAGEDLYVVLNYNLSSEGFFSGMERLQSDIAIKYTRTFRF